MSTEVRAPRFAYGSTQPIVSRWLKQPGEPVLAGEPLLIVVNDRLELALPAPGAGVLGQQHVSEAAAFAEGALLATIAPAPMPTLAAPVELSSADTAPVRQADRPLRATPTARRIAAARQISLAALSGSGVSGRIVKADVLATPAPTLAPQRVLAQPSRSTYVITAVEADLGRVAEACANSSQQFARRGLKLSDTACVIWAAAASLARHPQLNSAWNGDTMLLRRRTHLAVRLPDRTVLVRDAQDLELRGMARALGHAQPAEQGGSTFTIEVARGASWWAMPAPAAGQSATLGCGAVQPRPVVLGEQGAGALAVRPIMLLTLAYDVRVLDQRQADAFLIDLKARLERFPTS